MLLMVQSEASGRAAFTGSKWLQNVLSLVFAAVGVWGVGHGPEGGQAPAVFPPEPLAALVPAFPPLQSPPYVHFPSSPLAVAVLDPGMPFLAGEALSAHLEDVWGSWLDAGCLRISIVRLRGPIHRAKCEGL